MLSARAIAVQGVGFGPALMAAQGFGALSATAEAFAGGWRDPYAYADRARRKRDRQREEEREEREERVEVRPEARRPERLPGTIRMKDVLGRVQMSSDTRLASQIEARGRKRARDRRRQDEELLLM